MQIRKNAMTGRLEEDRKTMYQNFIFDLYGTLADIHTNEKKPYLWKKLALFLGMKGAHYQPGELKALYSRLIHEQEEALRKAMGQSGCPEVEIGAVFRRMYEQKGCALSQEEIRDTARLFRCISLEHLEVFEGAEEMLAALRQAGKRVYLLSNAQALFTAPEIRYLGLDRYFDGMLLSSEAGVKKPDRAFYHMLLEKYSLAPGESLMIGNDDLADCHGAAAAGIRSLYIHTEQSPERKIPLPANCTEITHISQTAEFI